MELELKPPVGATHKRKRVGRGTGTGKGKTCGKGENGQKSRSGKVHPYVGFEGGQMPIFRRLPKRGFKNINRKQAFVLNVNRLKIFNDGDEVNLQVLKDRNLIPLTAQYIKILGNGEVEVKNLKIKVHAVSQTAQKKLEEASADVEILPGYINEKKIRRRKGALKKLQARVEQNKKAIEESRKKAQAPVDKKKSKGKQKEAAAPLAEGKKKKKK